MNFEAGFYFGCVIIEVGWAPAHVEIEEDVFFFECVEKFRRLAQVGFGVWIDFGEEAV